MAKIHGFHQGDRSEYLGRYLLSALGHTVMVERTADYFGVDMYLKLADLTGGRGQVLKLNGMECAIQIKSDYSPIPVDTEDARTALYNLRQPFFICVVDKKSKKISFFQTLGRFNSYWSDASKHVGIILGKHPEGFPFDPILPEELAALTPSGELKERLQASGGYIYCGDPIITIGLDKMFGDEEIDEVLRSNAEELIKWIELDNQAIVMKTLGLPGTAIFEVNPHDKTMEMPGVFMQQPTVEQLGLLLNCLSRLVRISGECFDLVVDDSVPGAPTIADMEKVRDYMHIFNQQISDERNRLFPDVRGSLFDFYLPGESARSESQRLPKTHPSDKLSNVE